MRLPKNLLKVLEDRNTDVSFSELFKDETNNPDMSSVKTIHDLVGGRGWIDFSMEALFNSTYEEKLLSVIKSIAQNVATRIVGFQSCSDILDNASHEEYIYYAPKYKKVSELSEGDHEDVFARCDFFKDVKRNCSIQINEALPKESLTEMEAFNDLILLLKSEGKFHLTEPASLEYILINSRLFQKFVTEEFQGEL